MIIPDQTGGGVRGRVLVFGRDVLQVGDLHEGLVEVVQLQDAGQQEEAGDEDAGEELGQSELLQADGCQPVDTRIISAGWQ